MTTFTDIVAVLKNKRPISINGAQKQAKGLARFTTLNMYPDEYIKAVFLDHSFLLLLLKEQEIYFAEKIIGKIPEIEDEVIGNIEMIEYKNKRYKLGNKQDYQYTLERYFGEFLDIEGECRFSDYFPESGEKEFLSLGWLSFNNERADLNPILLPLDQIKLG